jgi:hypothetical protein
MWEMCAVTAPHLYMASMLACRDSSITCAPQGVVAKFHGVLALRQAHGFAFQKSDLFFVTVLRLEDGGEGQSNGGGELQAQESEIEAVAWLPMEEYAGQEFMRSQALHAQILDTCGPCPGSALPVMTGLSVTDAIVCWVDLGRATLAALECLAATRACARPGWMCRVRLRLCPAAAPSAAACALG